MDYDSGAARRDEFSIDGYSGDETPDACLTAAGAEVIGDITAAYLDLIGSAITAITGKYHWRGCDHNSERNGIGWRNRRSIVLRLLETVAAHCEGPKEGFALVLASSLEPGAETPREGIRTDREAAKMRHIRALGIDIDAGAAPDGLIATAQRRAVCCAIYTTHSHGRTETAHDVAAMRRALGLDDAAPVTAAQVVDYLRDKGHREDWLATVQVIETRTIAKLDPRTKRTRDVAEIVIRHAPWQKVRLIVFLDRAVKLSDLRPGEYAAILRGVAKLFGVQMDESCTDPSRMFYGPRHAPGAPFRSIIVRGGPLRLEDIERVACPPPRRRLRAGKFAACGEYPVLDGFPLVRWRMLHGDRFLITSFLENIGVELFARSGDKLHMDCPFNHEHSNAGERDTATFCVDGGVDYDRQGRPNLATIKCMHHSCARRGTAEMLYALAHSPDVGIPDQHPNFTRMLCADHYYAEVEGGL